MPSSEFRNFEIRYYEVELMRIIDEIVGHLLSMSWASKKLFGKQASYFENEFKQKLEAISKSEKFVEKLTLVAICSQSNLEKIKIFTKFDAKKLSICWTQNDNLAVYE